MNKTAIWGLTVLFVHFFGMIVYVAALDTVGKCNAPYLEQPAHCLPWKAGAGLWEAMLIYGGVVLVIESVTGE